MNKDFADATIADYVKKIYSFSLSKLQNIDEAEELSARITYEVYMSLLKAEYVHDVNSYIYRIARNVYARYLIEEKTDNNLLQQKSLIPITKTEDKDKVYSKLRREISYLSNLQREIVILHYFNKMTLKKIAEQLKLPHGTVCWHLFEARNQIKASFKESEQSVRKPQYMKFTNMISLGYLGKRSIVLPFYFTKSLSQRIAYSAYYQAKTSKEIAKELSIPLAFVEDEINHLVENRFIDKTAGNKYITNMYLMVFNKERKEKVNNIMRKYENMVSEMYVPLLFDFVKKFSDKIYTPNKDKNFLMWSIISYACWKKLIIKNIESIIPKFCIHRKDSGYYIATARVIEDANSKSESNFEFVDITSFSKTCATTIWHCLTKFDSRNKNFLTFNDHETDLLYDYICGNITKTPGNIDKYMKLYDNGYIVSAKKHKENANFVITTLADKELVSLLPDIPDELRKKYFLLDEEIYNINKTFFPEQMQNLCRAVNHNSLSGGRVRVVILENLLKNGVLKPLKDNQKKTVNMIMFTDRLP